MQQNTLPKLILIFVMMVVLVHTKAQTTTTTFNYTGSVQSFTVPPCVTTLSVTAKGAKGGGPGGGNGATVMAVMVVTPGQVLQIRVGGMGSCPGAGYNGGGAGDPGTWTSCGGGGATDIRIAPYALNNRVIVAAGGGGQAGGSPSNAAGGAGGCISGNSGTGSYGGAGTGGTQTAGGTGGWPYSSPGTSGQAGSLGQGGNCGIDNCTSSASGGGGGGGYYGGGGGGPDCISFTSYVGGGGGGGGSSLVPAGGSCTAGNNSTNGSLTIIYNTSSIVPTASNTGPYCPGATIQLNCTPVGTMYTYAWSGPNSYTANVQNPTIPNAAPVNGGVYTVTITAVGGCATATVSTTVTINSGPTLTVSNTGPYCPAATIQLNAIGATSYSWTGPNTFTSTAANPTVANASATTAGVYTVVGTLGTCTASATTTVSLNPLPNVTATSSAICYTQGTATLTAAGASTYTWSAGTTPSTGATVTAAPAATTIYTVTGTDANGCQNTATSTVTVNPLPVISVTNTGPYCPNGTIQLNASGGTGYSWSGPNTYTSGVQNPSIPNASSAEAGQYDVTVTDANGCTSQGSTTVVVNSGITPALTSNSPVCEQQDSIVLNCANGVSWVWSGPQGALPSVQNPVIWPATLADAGTYSVTVTDADGCVGTGTISVSVNALPVVTVTSDVICFSQDTAILTAAGASSYSWSAGTVPSSGSIVGAVPASTTTYTVTGTDGNGCTNTATSTVTVNPLPNVTVTSAAVCNGDTATITSSGAVSYAWTAGTTPGTGATVTASPAVTTQYTVTGTDANGCINTAVSTVTINNPSSFDAGIDDTVCTGNTVMLSATGPATATYVWNPGNMTGQTQSFTAASSQTYSVSCTDVNGCVSYDSVTVTVPAPIVLSAAGFAATCNAACNGQLVVLPSPSSGPFSTYTYSWSPGGYTTASVLNVCAGNYAVTVTNNAGCVATATASVTEPPALVANASNNTPASCNSACDGSVTINASGGTGAYGYSWSSLGSGSTPSNLCAGNYTCTVTDANNCSTTVAVTITEPTVISASIAQVATICIGQTANLNATASGGNGAYVYTWTGGTTPANAASVTASPTVTSTYSVSITDVNGCAPGTASVTVTVNPPLSVVASADVTICAGDNTTLSATATGGNGVYSYAWAGGPAPGSGQSITTSPSVTSTYTVVVTDACGTPSASDNVVVTVNPLPVISVSVSQPDGCAPVCTKFTATSTPVEVSANWTFTDNQTVSGNPTSDVCFTSAGVYGATISVTDINGCQNTFTNNNLVTVYPIPTAEFTFDPQPAYVTNPIITFTDQSSGAVVTGWNWLFGTGDSIPSSQQNPVFIYTDAGTYNVTLAVVSDEGCMDTVSHPVVISPEFIIYVPNSFSPNGDGINDQFFPKGVGVNTDQYEIWIYNRWGNMIFYTNDWNEGWDGKVDGTTVQQDVYVWKIKVRTYENEKKFYVGHVTVVK